MKKNKIGSKKAEMFNERSFKWFRCGDNTTKTRHYTQDDSIISYGRYNPRYNSIQLCSKCFNRDNQKVFIHTDSIYHRRFTHLQSTCWNNNNPLWKPKMLRTLGHCFLLLLFIGVSCFGLLYGRPLSNDKQSYNDTNIELGGPNNLNMINYLTQGVSLSQFRKMSKNATSFRDIYRIFLHDKQTSDDEIDKMLTTRPFGGLFKHTRDYDYDDYFETEKWPGEDYDFNTDIKNVADEAYEHYLAVKDHPLGRCYEPTPELRHIPPEGNKLYFPEYTILHVCRNVSGCCWNPMQECAEKDIEIVSKSFIVTEIQHTDHGDEVYVPEANKVEVKLFKNVTRCGCIELNPLPRCEKKCPFPFIMERPGTECICDCKDDTLSCLKIKYGIEPLSEQSFSCVKSGNCMKPQCESGGFDMRKGYCPGMNDARWKLHNRDKRNANFLSQQKSKLIVKQRKSKLNDKLHRNR